MGYKFNRIGFDEKKDYVDNYFNLNSLLRNLPDYVVSTNKNTYVVNVKGTANIKKSEIDMIPLFLDWFSSKTSPLVYAFCFKTEKRPIMVYPETVIKLYSKSIDKQWHDGKIYRTLDFSTNNKPLE